MESPVKPHLPVIVLGGLLTAVVSVAATTSEVGASPAGSTRLIPLAGSSSPVTGGFTASGPGDVTNVEFVGESDEGEDDDEGSDAFIVDRSLSRGANTGVPVTSGKKAKS